MREVVTVKGIIEPSEIGFTQFHEHLLISRGRSYDVNPTLCMESISKSTEDVLDFKKAGGHTIIDAQPGGCNRMASGLKEISEKTDVNIICSTGFHKMGFYYDTHPIFTLSEEKLTDIFVKELTSRISCGNEFEFTDEGSGIKAGIIKTALDSVNLTPQYAKLFSAAAEAAKKTQRTIMVHIEKESAPELLLDFFIKKGIKPEWLVFCHMDRAIDDLGIHEEIMKAGVFLEFDTIGRYKYHSDEREAEILKSHIGKGFENKLLFSLDSTASRLKSYTPDSEIGLDYIFRKFIPCLKNYGVTNEQIEKISTANVISAIAG